MVVSLLELAVRKAIDNLQYIGDVGETDLQLLKRILPHCTAEQLHHIETSTKGRDLSSVTDELWRKCYGRKWGNDQLEKAQGMPQSKRKYPWRRLYQNKLREEAETQRKGVNRLRELYKEQNSQKESRQMKPVDLKPPESKRLKRTFTAGSSGSSKVVAKGRLMQKSRMDFAKSNQASRNATMARNRSNLNNGINQRTGGSSRR
jgi:elongin-A